MNNSVMLCMDLTDKVYEVELTKNKLSAELNEKLEKLQKIKKFEKFEVALLEKERKIKEKQSILKDMNNNLNYYKKLKEQNNKEIEALTIKKNELLELCPLKDKITNNYQNLNQYEFCKLKFSQIKIEDDYIYSTVEKDLYEYKEYIDYRMEEKYKKVNKLLNVINDIINRITNEFQIKLYGSYAHKLAVPWSNVDLLIVSTNYQKQQDEYIMILEKIGNTLNQLKWVSNIQLENMSTYKSIRILTTIEYDELVLSLTYENELIGMSSVDLINGYKEEYAIIEPMLLALKTIFNNSNLCSRHLGGLSSYGIIILLVSFLQNKYDNYKNNNNNDNIIGKIFVGFLAHYGIYFDFQKFIISAKLPKIKMLENYAQTDNNYNFLSVQHELVITDPLNPKNNIAKNCHEYMNIKMAMMIAYMVTREDCECGCHYGKGIYSYLHNDLDHCILKRMFNSVKRFTENN